MTGRRTATAVAALVLLLGLLWSFAGTVGIARLPLVAGLVGPRNAVTIALLAVGAAAVLVAGLRARVRRILAPTAAALLVVAAVSGATAFGRGFSAEPPDPVGSGLRILSWNTNGDLVRPEVVARLAAREHADVVVLPEVAAAASGRLLLPAFQATGLRVTAFPAIDRRAAETVVLVRSGLRYSPAVGHSAVPDKSAAVTPVDRRLPVIVALHASQPMFADNARWQADLRWVAARCADPDTIAVGDFNATVDGFEADRLGGCSDAAAARGAASLGTWPTRLPTWAGMPLDHVLTGSAWRTRSFTVLGDEDGSGARHRPILAVVEHR